MSPLQITARMVALHLVIVTPAVTGLSLFLHGTSMAEAVLWTGPIVAIWTVPITVFISWFAGRDLFGKSDSSSASRLV